MEQRIEMAEQRIAALEAETAQLRAVLKKTLNAMELLLNHTYDESQRGFFRWGASDNLASAMTAFHEADKALPQKPKER